MRALFAIMMSISSYYIYLAMQNFLINGKNFPFKLPSREKKRMLSIMASRYQKGRGAYYPPLLNPEISEAASESSLKDIREKRVDSVIKLLLFS